LATNPHLSVPDQHLDSTVAARYDEAVAERFDPEVVAPTVTLLAELAGKGPAVEFAIGTGRIALPLADTGVTVRGIDISEPMLAELRAKAGADKVDVVIGDMTETQVCDDATLVYLVFNTIGNLRTQQLQVECFRNASAHLAAGGRFVIETNVPGLHRLPPGETIRPFDVSPHHLGFDEYVDRVEQILLSHHDYIDSDRVRTVSGAFRYVWPSELDLMAQLAGMSLEARWADWHRSPFTGDSPAHVSVWRKDVEASTTVVDSNKCS
jgi:SAM-dependent methyltransferase